METNKAQAENRQIQEERMRGYFIESAKNLIKGEGLKSISVRNVAHHAGYSYATIYNYFKDINELLFRCVEDFCREAEDFVAAKTKERQGIEGIKAVARAYVAYFAEYPGIFELFFLERMGDFGNKPQTAALITGLFDRLSAAHWETAVAKGEIDPERARKGRLQLHYQLPGMLLFYENRMEPVSYVEFMGHLESAIDKAING